MSGNYFIDPDGPFAGDYPISVYCDLNSGKTFTEKITSVFLKKYSWKIFFILLSIGVTKIDHDLVGAIEVKKCQEPGCFPQSITYQSSINQIAALATLSKNCEQHFRVSFYFENFILVF